MKRNYVHIFASTIVFMMSACLKSDRDNSVQEEIEITKVQYANDFRGRLLCEFTETTYEYDSYGNEIHYKDSFGFGTWSEYDEKGNKIYFKDPVPNNLASESWYDYDSQGKQIHDKNSSGRESWYEYDANGNMVHWKDSDDNESWYEYDERGNKIHAVEVYYWESWQVVGESEKINHSRVKHESEE